MGIYYKVDIIQELKEHGYSTYRIRKDKLFGEGYLQQLRHGELVSWEVFTRICELLDCQPGDLIEYVKENKNRED